MSSELASALAETSRQFLVEPQASLLNGILFGGQSHLPQDLITALRTTGTLHVVAVSGQNMSILAGMIGGVSRFLGWRLSLIIQGTAIIGYIFLVGGGASVVRSGVMALIALFAAATGRQYDAGRALAVAGAGMVILHPDYLSDIGWQLSFVATVGIIWLSPLIEGWLNRYSHLVSSLVSIPLSAQIMTWPIIAANFGTFSLIGVPTNVAIEWTVPWIMGLGAVSLLISQIWLTLGQILSWLALVPLTYFIEVVRILAQVPLAQFDLEVLPAGIIVIYYTLMLGLIWKWSVLKVS